MTAGDYVDLLATETSFESALGINNRAELAEAEAIWQTRKRRDAMLSGVTLIAMLPVPVVAVEKLTRSIWTEFATVSLSDFARVCVQRPGPVVHRDVTLGMVHRGVTALGEVGEDGALHQGIVMTTARS